MASSERLPAHATHFFPPVLPPTASRDISHQNARQLPTPNSQAQRMQTDLSFTQNALLPPPHMQTQPLDPGQFSKLLQGMKNSSSSLPSPFELMPFPPPPPPSFSHPLFPMQHLLPNRIPVPPPLAATISRPPNNRVTSTIQADKEEGELSEEPGSSDKPDRLWPRNGQRRAEKGDYHLQRHPVAVTNSLGLHQTHGNPYHALRNTDVRATIGNGIHRGTIRSQDVKARSAQASNEHQPTLPIHARKDGPTPEYGSKTLRNSATSVANTVPQLRRDLCLDDGPSPDKATLEDQKRRTKQFMVVLRDYGYECKDLQKCGLDPKLLQEIWPSESLPLNQEPPQREPLLPPPPQSKAGPASLSVPPVVPASPSAQTSTARSAYIARLMAAKSQKSSATSGQGTSFPVPTPATLVQAPSQLGLTSSTDVQISTRQEPTPTTNTASLAAQKKEQQNELLRTRLEALNKKPKQSLQKGMESSSASTTPTSADSIAGPAPKTTVPMDSYPSEIGAAPLKNALISPCSPMRPSGGIPGLFMTAPGSQVATHPAEGPSVRATCKGRKRPVAADFNDGQQAQPPTSAKRPFGQSYKHHEQMVIEVSDDDIADGTMDIDEADELQPSTKSASQPPSRGAHGNISTPKPFPSYRPNASRRVSSNSTPPTSKAPFSNARVGDLKRKEEELDALRKALAEKERQRLAKVQSSRKQTPVIPTGKALQTPPTVRNLSAPVLAGKTNGGLQAVIQPGSIASSGPAPPGWKCSKREEIKSRIAASDAHHTSNEGKLEMLRREMDRIQAENKDKQKQQTWLLNELQKLDADRQGTPHKELPDTTNKTDQCQATNAASVSAMNLDGNPVFKETNNVQSPTVDRSISDSSGDPMALSDGEVGNESDTTEVEMDLSNSDVEADEISAVKTSALTTEVSQAPKTMEPFEQHDAEGFSQPSMNCGEQQPNGMVAGTARAASSEAMDEGEHGRDQYVPLGASTKTVPRQDPAKITEGRVIQSDAGLVSKGPGRQNRRTTVLGDDLVSAHGDRDGLPIGNLKGHDFYKPYTAYESPLKGFQPR